MNKIITFNFDLYNTLIILKLSLKIMLIRFNILIKKTLLFY